MCWVMQGHELVKRVRNPGLRLVNLGELVPALSLRLLTHGVGHSPSSIYLRELSGCEGDA